MTVPTRSRPKTDWGICRHYRMKQRSAVLEPYALKQWLSLLKTLYIDKTAAEMAGRKFVESEKRYYGIITERLITILSAALDQSPKQSEAMLNAVLEAGTQEG